jgi:hypothetical protein
MSETLEVLQQTLLEQEARLAVLEAARAGADAVPADVTREARAVFDRVEGALDCGSPWVWSCVQCRCPCVCVGEREAENVMKSG